MSDNGEDIHKGMVRPATFNIVRRLVAFLCGLIFGLRIKGQKNIPAEGGFILVGNHLHNLDPVFMLTSCTRPVYFMAKQELFAFPVIKQLITWVGAFPVNRGKMDRSAIRHGQKVLQEGIGLGIYPEGTRSLSRQIERALPGAGLFATGGDYLIVPCAVTGSERVPFNGAKGKGDLPRRDPGHKGVLVEFGEPFRLPEEIDGKKANARAATDYMMRKVAELLPPDYRGMYAEAVATSE
jgi:1-acyl-sn-glycerol-3-phosphate acyltransferase